MPTTTIKKRKQKNGSEELAQRTASGVFCGWVGIGSNLLLFVVKLAIGIVSGSIAVMADAVNNLSDMGSSAITLISFKLSSKPPDQQHPFGHGRLEYIAGIIIAVIVISVGLNFLKIAFERIMNPIEITVSLPALIILTASLPLKAGLFFFYRHQARLLASPALQASAFDSLSDVLSTSLVIISFVSTSFTNFPIDGIAALLIAFFIVWGGIRVLRGIINPLLGERPDPKLVEELQQRLQQCPGICGIHDLIMHNYGPGRYFTTAHAEVNPDDDPVLIHDLLEAAEKEIARTMPIRLLLHFDPFSSEEPELKAWREQSLEIINKFDPELQLNDFRLDKVEDQTPRIRFNLLVPHNYPVDKKKLIQQLKLQLQQKNEELQVEINIVNSFV